MIFQVKYLVAGMAPASELYSRLKSKLENLLFSDTAEAEVLGPYPEPDQRIYPVVPVTFKLDTHGYESEMTILFDIFLNTIEIREEMTAENFLVGLKEISVDGRNTEFPEAFVLGDLPVIEL